MSHLSNPKMAELGNADSPQEVLYVHQSLLDEQCRPLCDELREYWNVFDIETVRRFALYLYNADYSYPAPAPVETTKTTTPTSDVSKKTHRWPSLFGGDSDSSTSFDAAPTIPALETVEKPGPLLSEPFGSAKPTSGASTKIAGTTGGLFGTATSGGGLFGAAIPVAPNTQSTTGGGGFGATKPVAPNSASAFGGGGFGTAKPAASNTPSSIFGGGSSGTAKAAPGDLATTTGAFGGFGGARPGTTSLFGNAANTRILPGSGNSSAPVIGTLYPRPKFVPTEMGENDPIEGVPFLHNIMSMPEYSGWSAEELRLQDYLALGKLDRASPGKVHAGQAPPPVRPLTPLKSFRIEYLHGTRKPTPPERPKHPAGYDFEAVLLAHAKLYILSRSQGVNALSDLCISRLLQELIELSVPPIQPRISDNVVNLLRYVYCPPREMVTPGALRPAWRQLQNLSSQFCALNIHTMGREPGFRALLQEAGTLAADIMDKTLRRLMAAESGLLDWNHLAARDAAIKRLFGTPRNPAPVGPTIGR